MKVNNNEEVKIIYCYDENKTAIHYSKSIKGNTYYCVDCGSELIVKDGNKKIKHLAHKNTINCGGTGESIFHKHWKENLFKAGMFINVANRISSPENVEILDVLNEISLCERYNKNWHKDIIVDVLLITEKGDIVIEINYKNAKKWDELKPFYDELTLLRVYEVTVDKSVNTPLKWFCLGEEEEIEKIQKEKRISEYNERKQKEREKEERRLNREKIKFEERKKRENEIEEMIKLQRYRVCTIFYNFKNNLQKVVENTYTLHCLVKIKHFQYEDIKIRFNIKNIQYNEDNLLKMFKSTSGIKYCRIVLDDNPIDNYHDAIEILESGNEEYNARLYAKLCNLN